MKNAIWSIMLIVGTWGAVKAETVNPASNVTADSANTVHTIPYRDSSGNFSIGVISATGVAVSSSSSSAYPMRYDGAYSSSEAALLSANPNRFIFNTTLTTLCSSSATASALQGAWVLNRSTSTTDNLVRCF